MITETEAFNNLLKVHLSTEDGTLVVFSELVYQEKRDAYAKALFNFCLTLKTDSGIRSFIRAIELKVFPVREFLLLDEEIGNPAPFCLISTRKEAILSELIDASKDCCPELLLRPNPNGVTALHYAIEAALANIAQSLIEVNRGNPDLLFQADKQGNTALHYAMSKGNKGVINLLIDVAQERPDLLFRADEDGQTALHDAILGDRETAALLINAVKDSRPDLLFHADKDGDTALHYAIRYGSPEIAMLLINRVKDSRPDLLDKPNLSGQAALDVIEPKAKNWDLVRQNLLGIKDGFAAAELEKTLEKVIGARSDAPPEGLGETIAHATGIDGRK